MVRPTWLFSSGPVGDPLRPEEAPDVDVLVERIRPRGHRVLAGRLAREDLSFAERAVTRAVKAEYGDFRDWDDVAEFADEIAHALNDLCLL